MMAALMIVGAVLGLVLCAYAVGAIAEVFGVEK